VKDRTVAELAGMAECSDPDTDSSPGADFLRAIESSVADALNTIDADSGVVTERMQERAAEIADYCVPVYTHNLWATFVDLCAYSEDLSDIGYEFDISHGIGQIPSWALYMIGERLALALFEDELPEDEGTE
jgi:hypothetical protein